MPKGYVTMTPVSPTYELVQLLRLNGVMVERGCDHQHVRVQLAKGLQFEHMSVQALKKRFGPGTTSYNILTKHPRANTILKVPAYKASRA